MKTKGTFFSIVLLLASTFVFAGGDPSMQQLAIVKSGADVFKVIYEGKADQPITLQLSSPEGLLVYSKKVSSISGFICPLNFTGMKAGNYVVKVTQGSEASTATIAYGVKADRPFVQIKAVADHKYVVLVPNTASRITVAIYDAYNNVVGSYAENANGSYGKVFDLSKMPAALYTFVVSDNEKVIQTKTL
jgi:hypothetical protein